MIPDEYYMKAAFGLAKKGEGKTSPNPMVGAVIVKNGKIIGKGFHEGFGKPHAEANAIDNATQDCTGADIHVNLEPCNHYGKNPPCTEKIIKAGIKRVFIAMPDPNPDVAGGGIDFLRKKGLEVISGICEKEAKKLNEVFIKYVTTKRPFVIMKCASTLDGRIAARTGDSKWITGDKAREYVHKLRNIVNGIMVGIDTIKKDNPSLTARIGGVKTEDPARFILDAKLSINSDSKILNLESSAKTFIITGDSVPAAKKKSIENENVQIITAPLSDNGYIDLDSLMEILGKIGIASLLIEGGSKVISSAFFANIVDKVYFFYAPKITGGDDGIPICSGIGCDKINMSKKIENIEIKRFGDDILIEGYVCNN